MQDKERVELLARTEEKMEWLANEFEGLRIALVKRPGCFWDDEERKRVKSKAVSLAWAVESLSRGVTEVALSLGATYTGEE